MQSFSVLCLIKLFSLKQVILKKTIFRAKFTQIINFQKITKNLIFIQWGSNLGSKGIFVCWSFFVLCNI